jgi:hypothetical protein
MNEVHRRDEIPSRAALSKMGITAIGNMAAGVFIFVLQFFARIRGLGLVLGAVVCIFGIASLMSKDPDDRKAGIIITAAGGLVFLSRIPIIAPVASTLLSIGAVGLFAMGIWNGIKFLIGLKKRS